MLQRFLFFFQLLSSYLIELLSFLLVFILFLIVLFALVNHHRKLLISLKFTFLCVNVLQYFLLLVVSAHPHLARIRDQC